MTLVYISQLADGEGRASRLVLWSHPGNDVTGLIARADKVAGTAEQVSSSEIYLQTFTL